MAALAGSPPARSSPFYDCVERIQQESWPGLSRPSTPCLLIRHKKDMDARDKRGHDAGGERFNHIGNWSRTTWPMVRMPALLVAVTDRVS
jgi:hypothetical protein